MRTVILVAGMLIAGEIRSAGPAAGKESPEEAITFLAILLLVCMLMDLSEYFKKLTK